MKKLVLILISFSFLLSFDFKNEFLKKNYKEVCDKGMSKYFKGNRDEKFLSLIGVACAHSDSFNPLGYLVKDLKKTKEGRNNALYFANLIFQKKLLYSYMLDDIDIAYFKTANTSNILSFVIQAISSKRFSKVDDKILIKEGKFLYKVYLSGDKVFIDKYNNTNLIERHWYR
jgi:hypothetical protein